MDFFSSGPNSWLEKGLVSGISGAVGAFIAYIIRLYRDDRRKFAGQWNVTIRWSPSWAKFLFGTTDQVHDPKSVGRIALGQGTGHDKQGYWGLGYFTLKSGDKSYAHLCLELSDVHIERVLLCSTAPYFFTTSLQSIVVEPLIRVKEAEFKYGASHSYRLRFERSSADRLEGQMLVIETSESDGILQEKELAVGVVLGVRAL